jgi:hypothetical protein
MTASMAVDTAKTQTRLAYQSQDCPMTLAQGLAEYYRANAGLVLRPGELSAESREVFRCHDMCHVIFGLGTTLDDEALADTRTLFSSDVGFRRYSKYLSTTPEAKALFKELGYGRAVWVTLLAIPRIFAAWRESWRMETKWPWRPPEDYLDRPLAELRRTFGIRVL